MFNWRWLRGIVRRNTAPLTVEQAAARKEKISILYCILSVNAFIGVLYACRTGKADWAKYFGLKSEAEIERSPGNYYVHISFFVPKIYIVRGFTYCFMHPKVGRLLPKYSQKLGDAVVSDQRKFSISLCLHISSLLTISWQ